MSANRIRHEVWERLEREGLVARPRPCYYRTPNFIGAGEAARRLAHLPEFLDAACILCGRDYVLEEVRREALRSGRRLALIHEGGLWEVSGIAAEDYDTLLWMNRVVDLGRPLSSRIDLVVIGSIAVAADGTRVGRREDPEETMIRALLGTALLPAETPIATLVHEAQLYRRIPKRSAYGLRVSVIVTPDRVIRPGEDGAATG